MKETVIIFLVLLLGVASIVNAEGSNLTTTALNGTTFVVVKDIGLNTSAIELFNIIDGKISLVDSLFIWEEPINRAVKYKRFIIKERTDILP